MSLVDRWTEENNTIIVRWKQHERGVQPLHDVKKQCHSESIQLLHKMQGIPAATERLPLEMTVSYNVFLFSLDFCLPSEMEQILIRTLLRVLEAVGSPVVISDPLKLWQVGLQTFDPSVYAPCLHKLLLIQWMLWLMEGQLERIAILLSWTNNKREVLEPVCLQTEVRNLTLTMEEDSSIMVARAARDLKDVLHISTVIAHGVEQLNKENYSEALEAFQEAKGRPSPRRLLAQIHMLIGQSLAKLDQPHCALHFYRKAVEVDFSCHSALYQSALVFRHLGNLKAEIEALCLLYSAVQQQVDKSPCSSSLVFPELLLGEKQMKFINRVPSTSLILYTLAHACVLNGSILDGVEYYLDLLASLQSDLVPRGVDTSFPRIPVVYLEAAFALLKAEKYRDVLVICEEVITSTLDFIPERLLIDLPMENQQTCECPDSDTMLENIDFVIWAGAAHLLQAQAQWKLKDTKETITHFTRAINQLVKVFVKQKDWKQRNLGNTEAMVERILTLETAKGQALAGRGLCYLENAQLKEALRDLHLSLQILPGCRNTEMWLTEVLWGLDRREEAVIQWRQSHDATCATKSINSPLYLQAWQDDSTSDFSDLKKRIEDHIQARNVIT